MKKLTLLISMMVMAVIGSFAADDASNHVQFLGIPIDGNVNVFGSELENKDFCINADYTKMAVNAGQYAKIYNGLYDGRNALAVVLYNPSSEDVCAVTVEIKCDSYENAFKTASETVMALFKEYGKSIVLNKESTIGDKVAFNVIGDDSAVIGAINVEVVNPKDNKPKVIVAFLDNANFDKQVNP